MRQAESMQFARGLGSWQREGSRQFRVNTVRLDGSGRLAHIPSIIFTTDWMFCNRLPTWLFHQTFRRTSCAVPLCCKSPTLSAVRCRHVAQQLSTSVRVAIMNLGSQDCTQIQVLDLHSATTFLSQNLPACQTGGLAPL